MGGTMLEENVVSATGHRFVMDRGEIVTLIKEAGFEPKVRNTRYEILGDA
jgi:cyclic dehypoxanthinyl futalosine synthase